MTRPLEPAITVSRRRQLGLAATVERRWPLILAAVIVLGAVLRLAGLGAQSFDHDEAVTVGRVLHPGLGATLREVPHSERTPYLYYGLAWLWTRVFRTGPVGIRSLSVLFGVLTIPVAFAAARVAVSEGPGLPSQRAGLIAAGLVAVDPFLVYYSQEARSYALLALLTACSLWAFATILVRRTPRAFALWSIVCTLALLTHYFAGFVVAAEALWLLAAVRPRRTALIAIAPPAVVGGALLPLLIHQAKLHAAPDTTSLARRLPTALVQFMFGERLSIRGLYTATPLVGLAALLAIAALTWLAWRWRWRKLAAIGTIALAGLLVPFGLDVGGGEYFNAKNCIGCLVALLIVAGGMLSLRRLRWLGAAGGTLLGAGGLAMSIALNVAPSLERPDYRSADALLGSSYSGRRALVVSAGGDTPTLLYRAGHDPQPFGSGAQLVSEIDILGGDDRSPRGSPPPGFRVVEQRNAGTVRVTRLVASTARLVTRATLISLSPDRPALPATPVLLLETKG